MLSHVTKDEHETAEIAEITEDLPVSLLRPLHPLRLFFRRQPNATVEGGGRMGAAATVYLLLM